VLIVPCRSPSVRHILRNRNIPDQQVLTSLGPRKRKAPSSVNNAVLSELVRGPYASYCRLVISYKCPKSKHTHPTEITRDSSRTFVCTTYMVLLIVQNVHVRFVYSQFPYHCFSCLSKSMKIPSFVNKRLTCVECLWFSIECLHFRCHYTMT